MEAGAAGVRSVGAPRGMLRVWGDDRLVARVRGGDDRAFEAIYDRHHRGLLSFCRHMLGSREEAEDALQHTFAAAYRALLRSDAAIQLKAWLYAIARNHCLSVLRARRESAPLDDESASIAGLADEVERRGELRALVTDLQRLPHDQRAALVLTELGAHSHEEIGVILGVRRDKVKALVFQARESLLTSRQARDTSCQDIREQLSVLRGGALRRASLRRHVELCHGCQAFRAEVARQRAAMALVLPVAPSLALKSAVLGPVLGAGAACAATGVTGGLTVTGAASSVGSGLSVAGKGMAAKALVAAAVAGGVGGSAVAVEEIHRHAPPAPKTAAAHVVRAAPARAPLAGGPLAAPVGPFRVVAPAASPAPSAGSDAKHPGGGAMRHETDGLAGGQTPAVMLAAPPLTAQPVGEPLAPSQPVLGEERGELGRQIGGDHEEVGAGNGGRGRPGRSQAGQQGQHGGEERGHQAKQDQRAPHGRQGQGRKQGERQGQGRKQEQQHGQQGRKQQQPPKEGGQQAQQGQQHQGAPTTQQDQWSQQPIQQQAPQQPQESQETQQGKRGRKDQRVQKRQAKPDATTEPRTSPPAPPPPQPSAPSEQQPAARPAKDAKNLGGSGNQSEGSAKHGQDEDY